jgi:glycosyltransferase involved in cell wall biosynthesis
VLCFSHLRWSFVYQRPQHLLTRLQREEQVLFFEEPIFGERASADLRVEVQPSGVMVLTPLLPVGASAVEDQRMLLDKFLAGRKMTCYLAWYYTPMALPFTRHLELDAVVYDCMDELSNFDGAPSELRLLEQELFQRADVVFVGGRSLYEVKRQRHSNAHLFPSSIDRDHFMVARRAMDDPADQKAITRPRIGFFGVLDERLDRELLRRVAELQPTWQFVLIGPTVKITPESLPQSPNLHYLGQKEYKELPAYLANWDVAMLPFAQNASTRFISPTKTPEYLAAGRPTVSTPIPDVIDPYGLNGLVEIAQDAEGFQRAIERLLEPRAPDWVERVDAYLQDLSWDRTFAGMWRHIQPFLARNSYGAIPASDDRKGEAANV